MPLTARRAAPSPREDPAPQPTVERRRPGSFAMRAYPVQAQRVFLGSGLNSLSDPTSGARARLNFPVPVDRRIIEQSHCKAHSGVAIKSPAWGRAFRSERSYFIAEPTASVSTRRFGSRHRDQLYGLAEPFALLDRLALCPCLQCRSGSPACPC